MLNEFKIYLGGAMTGLTYEQMNNWRVEIKRNIKHYSDYFNINLKIFNPIDFYNFEEKRHKTEEEVMDFDLDYLLSSNLIIVNTDNIEKSIGTISECALAWSKGIPVIGFGKTPEHPWLVRYFRRIDSNMEECCRYVKDFYLYL